MRVSDIFAALLAKYNKQFLDIGEVADALGIATTTARNQISAGTFALPTVCIGDRRLIPLAGLVNFIAEASGITEPEPVSTLFVDAETMSLPQVQKEKRNNKGGGRPSAAQNQIGREAGYKGWAEYRKALAAAGKEVCHA